MKKGHQNRHPRRRLTGAFYGFWALFAGVFLVSSVMVEAVPPKKRVLAVADYLVDVWNAESGLPNSSVTTVAQTPDGYLWVGTYNGLARFDGLQFVTFDPSNTRALQHARIEKLFVDAQGTLWINTYDGSLSTLRDGVFNLERMGDGAADPGVSLIWSSSTNVVFQMHGGTLIRKKCGTPPGEGWEVLNPPGRINSFLCSADAEGVIWCASRDQHLWRLRGERFDLVPETAGVPGERLNQITTDVRGRIWVATDTDFAVWDGSRFKSATPSNSPPAGATFLYSASNGVMWVVGNGQVRKLVNGRWDCEAEELRGILTGSFLRMGARDDHNGGIWLYDYGRGLFHVGSDGSVSRFTTSDGFPGERVDCFFEDREGNWWAGMGRGGLVRVHQKKFRTIAPKDGSVVKAAVGVCEDPSGSIWIAAMGGLSLLENGVLTNVPIPAVQSRTGGAPARDVLAVCPDADGRIWVSAGDEDLFLKEKNDDEFKPAARGSIHGVKCIFSDHAKRTWVGTMRGLHVAEDSSAPTRFHRFQGIARRDVRAIAEDKSGALWVGGGDGILYRIRDEEVTAFRPPEQTGPHAIWSLLADPDGTIWIGTFRGGLLRFQNGVFTSYGKREGMPDDVVCQILADGKNNLWIGSVQGIFRISKSALNEFSTGKVASIPATLYGRHDGLPSLECSGGYQPSAWRGQDGTLWFATLRGVVSIHPNEVQPNLLLPPVVIEEVLIDGRARQVPVGREPQIEVQPGRRQFEFRYTGLSLVSPDRVRFRYRLDQADQGWIEAGTRRSAQYSFLRPGTYIFHVRACNSDGFWNEEGASLKLRILPHFYETWWFDVLASVLALGTVGGAVWFGVTRRMRLQMQRLAQQRAIERERTRIAKDIHDDLGAGLTQITLLSELARRSPPQEAGGRLEQISTAARELTRGMDEIVWAVDPQKDTLDGLVTYVCKFAQEYLNVANIRCRLDLPDQLPPQPLRAEARHNLFLAIKEALNNIVKHARATEVNIALELRDSGFTVVIEDNGCGFVPGVPSSGSPERTLSGHGLGNLEKRLAEIGGRCSLRSRPEQGTRVELSIDFEGGSPVLASVVCRK